MIRTKHECKSSYYGTRYLICPVCKTRGGYDIIFDNQSKRPFKCKCGFGIREIKRESSKLFLK